MKKIIIVLGFVLLVGINMIGVQARVFYEKSTMHMISYEDARPIYTTTASAKGCFTTVHLLVDGGSLYHRSGGIATISDVIFGWHGHYHTFEKVK